jgi:hypothetical protein
MRFAFYSLCAQALKIVAVDLYTGYRDFQETNSNLLRLGTKSQHVYYAGRRFEKGFLQQLLRPGHQTDWGLLNLYIHILVLEQHENIAHIPWDLATDGINPETADLDAIVPVIFEPLTLDTAIYHYKLQWVMNLYCLRAHFFAF